MPSIFSDALRERVAEDLRQNWGAEGLRAIADRHGISATSVRKIAQDFGITAGQARAQAKSAVESTKAQNALRRERLASRMLDLAERFADEIESGQGSVVSGISFGEVVAQRLPYLVARDKQSLMTALGIAMDKHRMLDQYDSADDGSEMGRFLRALTGRDAEE